MRDNRPNNFEKEYVDAQWAKMEGLLDKTLPSTSATKTDNRVLWLLSALLLVTISSTIYYGYKYKSLIPTAGLTKEHTIIKTVYLSENLNTSKIKEVRNTTVSKITATSAQSIDTDQRSNMGSTYPNEYSNSVEPQISAASQQYVDAPPVYLADVEAIRQLKGGLLASKLKQPLFQLHKNPIEVSREKQSVSYNIGFETIATTDFDMTGLGINSGVVIPINNKMGLSTGLAINYLTKEDYFTSPFTRNGNHSVRDGQTVRTLKQVYVPLGLQYALNKFLALNSGVRLRYTYDEYVDGTLTKGKSLTISEPINEGSAFAQNANVGFTAGFLFQVNNNFSLLLNSEWRLNRVLKDQNLLGGPVPNYNGNMINLTTSYTF